MQVSTFKLSKLTKNVAQAIAGSMTQTSKMPCKSYSLPTVACITGFKMAQLPGSICASCYANKGNYKMYANNIEPAQHARLDSVVQACADTTGEVSADWVNAIVSMIGADTYFRWHDSGDLQSVDHLELIALVCELTPDCKHWLPTREYSIVKQYIDKFGALPSNLTVRLSAMYADKPVIIPKSLQGISGITASNVHSKADPIGEACKAPTQQGKCADCRACWTDTVISYAMH